MIKNDYLRAKRKMKKIKEFYKHLLVYILVNFMLVTLNLLTDAQNLWFIYPLLGWGISIVLHGIRTFGTDAIRKWEEKKTRKIMGKL